MIVENQCQYFLQATYALWKRELLAFVRQRSRLIGALATPLLFWALIGGGLGHSFQDTTTGGQGGYLEYFFPGMLALSVLFTAIFSTISVINDRHTGFLQGVLVSPAPRSALLTAKVLGGASLALLQGALLLMFAPLAGIALNLALLLQVFVLLFLMGAALTALSFLFAWRIDSVQGFHGIMNVVLMPLWILSGAMFPPSGANSIFVWVMRLNPLTYGVQGVRDAFNGATTLSSFLVAFAVLVVACAVLFVLSLRTMAQGQKT